MQHIGQKEVRKLLKSCTIIDAHFETFGDTLDRVILQKPDGHLLILTHDNCTTLGGGSDSWMEVIDVNTLETLC